MKKALSFILAAFITMSCFSFANADMSNVPVNLCESISELSTSGKKLFEEDTFVKVLMACFVMIDYCGYNPLYMPSFDHPAYIGLLEVDALYFAIPDTKGAYHILTYLPDKQILLYMGDEAKQASSKDAEYVMKISTVKYSILEAEDMYTGANYLLSISGQ